MRIEHILIGVAIFGFVMVTGLTLFTEQVDNNYISDANTSIFQNLTTPADRAHQQAEDIRDDLQNKGIISGVVDFFADAASTVKRTFSNIGLVGESVENIAVQTQMVDQPLVDLIQVIFMVLAGTFVLYMFWRFKPF